MENNIKTLIIPDAHARDFWKEPVYKVLKETDAKIVFLGDYVDPYPHEWEDTDIDYRGKVIADLEEIIDLKNENPDRITLLLGNHDCGYAISTDVCSCRMDRSRYRDIAHIFSENKDSFQLADEEYINGKHIIYSHAGIHKEYAEDCFGKDNVNSENVVNLFNDAYKEDNYGIMNSLAVYDHYRGWGGGFYGSLVWADVRSWLVDCNEESYGYMIFGHSQLKSEPIITQKIADLDVRIAFYLDNEGEIHKY